MRNYDSIINLPHHVSKKHPQMSNHDRAAQFAPFAALTGYDDAIVETARITSDEIELYGAELDEINAKFAQLLELISEQPEVEITYFVPDKKKTGGKYLTYKGKVKRIDTVNRQMFFVDKTMIELDKIIGIQSEIFTEVID